MPTIDELFDSMEYPMPYSAREEQICMIDGETRAISVPPTLSIAGVQNDKDVERIYFTVPKIVSDNIDLSGYRLSINYETASKNKYRYLVEERDISVNGDEIKFSWLVGRMPVEVSGNIRFSFCARKLDSEGNVLNEWNSTPATLPVLQTIEPASATPEVQDEAQRVINKVEELYYDLTATMKRTRKNTKMLRC